VLRAAEALTPEDLVVGLHACGELGDHAVRAAGRAGAAVAVVGCCPQKRAGERAPLADTHGVDPGALTFGPSVLGLANARDGELGVETDLETRVASRANRLALRALLNAAGRGVDPGGEMRGLNRRRATGTLAELVTHAFETHGLAAPAAAVVEQAARDAHAIHARMRRWDLPRAMLARLIEVWIALDRAAFLAGLGHEVDVVVAFDMAASPRNVAVVGTRAPRAA